MTRKRALGRQHRIESFNKQNTGHQTNDSDEELGSSPSNSASWYGYFGKKGLYRYQFLPKNDYSKGRRRPFRPVLSGLLKMIPFLAVVFVVSLTLPKLIFDAARYLTMSRPTILYGSPTDWKDVAGCLSRTHRLDVRDHFGTDDDAYHQYADLPLNPDVIWNWSRYSSSNSKKPSEDGEDGKSLANRTESSESLVPRRRLLIAQYSGKGSYEKLLQEVEPINRAYAKRWGHDYTTLVGTGLNFPGFIYETSQDDSSSATDGDRSGGNNRFCRYYNKSENTESLHGTNSSSLRTSVSSSKYNYEAQSTFNKIPLLFKAMEEPLQYDQVLILDSDTMIVDFDYDITSLLLGSDVADQDDDGGDDRIVENNQLDNLVDDESTTKTSNHDAGDDFSFFLVAYRVWKFDWLSTWDVNAGITLWNLRHPDTRVVAEDWLKLSLSDPKQVLLKNDDQYYLQRALQRLTKSTKTLIRDDKKHSGFRAFRMTSFRNWWKRHSFFPALCDYYRESISGTAFAQNTGTRRHNEFGVGIRAVRDELEYYDATVIKHFKRDTASWSRTGLDQRLLRIREVKVEICREWPHDCPS